VKPIVLVALLAAAVIAIGSLQLTRPGYSVDEEFTVFAVRGIQAHGLPVLPSGLLYDRGIAYSYASWLAGAMTGSELPAFRAVSLVSASWCVLLTFFLVRRATGDAAGVVAALFVTASVPFWATATTARFYAPFLGAYLLAVYFLTHRHWWIGLLAAAVLARLTHELAFTLAVIPFVCWLLEDRSERRRWVHAALSVVAGLVIGQAILFALHASMPSSGDTMVRRFFLWQVVNLFERPGDRQFGIPIVVMVIGWLIAPRRAWSVSVIALSIAAAIFAFSLARASNTAPVNLALIKDIALEGSHYPLDMLWHIVRATPLTITIVMSLMLARLQRGDWTRRERALHALWIGWVVWFGVIESGITTNYLLLPTAFMLMAIANDAMVVPITSEGEEHLAYDPDYVTPTWTRVTVVALMLLFVGVDQWRDHAWARARPTIVADGIDGIRDSLQPNDRVVCTDELGCLMLVGRIDRWLALDNYVRERFLVKRGDGPVTGVYTGVPAVFRPADVFAPNPDGSSPNRILIVDIFKEYPIGNSRLWLPKAIEEDGVPVTPLLETPQLRVVEVSRPERVALLQPSR